MSIKRLTYTIYSFFIAMFDICKNNHRVAQLHMTKTAYRLGEAVQGVLDFEHAILPTYEVKQTYI